MKECPSIDMQLGGEWMRSDPTVRRKLLHKLRNDADDTVKVAFPRFLYKFLPMPKANSKWESVLANCLAFGIQPLSVASRLNDPLELAFKSAPSDAKELSITIREKLFNSFPHLPIRERRDVAKRIADDLAEESASREFIKRQLERLGILCLTRDPRSFLMWSHYADSHQGLAVQYYVPNAPRLLEAFPLRYSEDPLPELRLPICIDDFEQVLLTKGGEWSYEKEHRLVLRDIDGKCAELGQCAVSGVIFGLAASKEDEKRISSIVGAAEELRGSRIKTWKAKSRSGTRRLKITRL